MKILSILKAFSFFVAVSLLAAYMPASDLSANAQPHTRSEPAKQANDAQPTSGEAPVAMDDSGAGFITNEDGPLTTLSVLANDSDPENETLFVTDFYTSATLGLITLAPPWLDGALDPSFGNGGLVATDFGFSEAGNAIALQPDGKIVTAGYIIRDGGPGFPDTAHLFPYWPVTNMDTKFDLALARHHPDGSLDTSFSGDGKTTIDVVGGNIAGNGVVVQPDGKIIVVGRTDMTYGEGDIFMARYNPDGSLDTTFGGGLVITDIGANEDGSDITLRPDGKILVAGSSSVGPEYNYDFALASYNPDGSLDTSFGEDGLVTTDLGGSDYSSALALQPDGKVIVAGTVQEGLSYYFALARYNLDGSLDTTFDGDGMLVTANAGDRCHGQDVALQTDGRILVVGYDQFNFVLIRYLPDGSLDTTFDGDGLVTTDFDGYYDWAYALTLQPDGKIVAVGYAHEYIYGDFVAFALARYHTDGSLDADFDGDGQVLSDFNRGDDVFDVTLQPDGKIVVAGSTTPAILPDFALARYQPGCEGGCFNYDPNGQFDGLAAGEIATDTLTYVVSDGTLTDTATISITIMGVNDAPSAVDDAFTTNEDRPLNVAAPGVLGNDTDVDGDQLSVLLVTAPADGSLTLAPDGAFTYSPALDYHGLDTFTYLVGDGILTDTATVSITVQAVNDAPFVYVGEGQSVVEGELVSFSGVYTDPDSLSVEIAWDFGDGVTASNILTPTHIYADDLLSTVTLVITDDVGAVGTDVLSVTVMNASPVLSPLADQAIAAGDILTLTATLTDPGPLDTHTVEIAWGDGLTQTLMLPIGASSFDVARYYEVAGIYTVTLTLKDDDSGADVASFVVTVTQAGYSLWLPIINKSTTP